LDSRRLRFRCTDQTCGPVAIDFLKLVLIDQKVAAAGRISWLSSERPQYSNNGRSGHQGENDPKRHFSKRLKCEASRPSTMSACRCHALVGAIRRRAFTPRAAYNRNGTLTAGISQQARPPCRSWADSQSFATGKVRG